MTSSAFLAWSTTRPRGERYELVDGEVVVMAPERNRHALVKMDAATEFDRAVRDAGLSCVVFPDGASVVVDERTVYEPDVTVTCATTLDLDAVVVPEPIIVVEVISPRSQAVDTGRKLVGYFSLKSTVHYLVIDSSKLTVTHHHRTADAIGTRILRSGGLCLDPPGLEINVERLFRRVDDRP